MKLKPSENPFIGAMMRQNGMFVRHCSMRFVNLDTGVVYMVSDRRACPQFNLDGSRVNVRFEGYGLTRCTGFDADVAENDASVLARAVGFPGGQKISEPPLNVSDKGRAFLETRVKRADLRVVSRHDVPEEELIA